MQNNTSNLATVCFGFDFSACAENKRNDADSNELAAFSFLFPPGFNNGTIITSGIIMMNI
jgi:hypothetical protein